MADDYWDSIYYVYQPADPNNYTAADRPNSNSIYGIIIHVTQGSWASAINWFQNPNAQASSHYVVRSSDGAVCESVLEKNIAWHAGNWAYNRASIGIEHEGYVGNPAWFTEEMYDSSARLAAYLCNKYGIPIDRYHIIGHSEVPDPYDPGQYGGVSNHTDPGYYWDWDKYINYIWYYADILSGAY
jgi:N-acetyl-anhydromuramyl-L-alanine amidase AmpD